MLQILAYPGTTACNRTNDSLELVSFYNQFDGDNWTDNTNWFVPGNSIDTWVWCCKSAHKAKYRVTS
ncbi:MAG: hypothetical protein U0T81_12320 [Saprospiraceae bacterium]